MGGLFVGKDMSLVGVYKVFIWDRFGCGGGLEIEFEC